MAAVEAKDVVVGVAGLYEVSQAAKGSTPLSPPVTVVGVNRKEGVCSVRVGLTEHVHDHLPVDRLRRRKSLQDAAAPPSDSDSAEEAEKTVRMRLVAMSPLRPQSPQTTQNGGPVPPVSRNRAPETGKSSRRVVKRSSRGVNYRDPKEGSKEERRVSPIRARRSACSVGHMVPAAEEGKREWTADDIVTRWRQLSMEEKCRAAELIGREHQDELRGVHGVAGTARLRLFFGMRICVCVCARAK
eukprot:Hpha_TRINITY_DN15626_c3_g7::TRINITY_DN15626_c3_g7_i1::g.100218::m.100218